MLGGAEFEKYGVRNFTMNKSVIDFISGDYEYSPRFHFDFNKTLWSPSRIKTDRTKGTKTFIGKCNEQCSKLTVDLEKFSKGETHFVVEFMQAYHAARTHNIEFPIKTSEERFRAATLDFREACPGVRNPLLI